MMPVASFYRAMMALFVALTMGGCAPSFMLEDRIEIRGDTPVTDCAGRSFLGVNATHRPGDYLYDTKYGEEIAVTVPTDPNCTGHRKDEKVGIPVRPGTVLHIATPTLGPAAKVFDPQRFPALRPQLAGEFRLPIRKLGADSRLFDEEKFFLAAVVSMGRSKSFETQLDTLAPILVEHETAIWNALIGALRIKRVASGTGRSYELAIVLFPDLLCKGLADRNIPADKRNVISKSLTDEACGGAAEPRSIFTEDVPAGSTYDALTKNEKRGRSEFFGEQIGDVRKATQAMYSFVTIELNGVHLRGDDALEARWTLADWENSGVCLDARGSSRRIDTITVPALGARFRIVDRATEAPSHRVSVIVTQLVQRRSIVPVDERQSVFDMTLARSDLARLTPRDVTDLSWTGGDASAPDRCTYR